jgi:hypothetical protein
MKAKLYIFLLCFSLLKLNGQVIADHRIVDQFNDIPQKYIDSVKKMWVQVLGESHSGGYRTGLDLLAKENRKFKATSQGIGEPGRLIVPNPCDTAKYGLRISLLYWDRTQFELGNQGGWYFRHYDYTGFPYDRYVGVGEEDFWTTQWAVDNMKANVAACNDHQKGNSPLSAIGFAWCWTDLNGNASQLDTEYGVHWGGYTTYYWNGNGFSMAQSWGINAADSLLTNNKISLDNYINAIIEIGKVYPKTLCFFTTGPVDPLNDAQSQENSESEYQKNIKYNYIRNYVKNNGGYLLDYADILSYNNAGEQQTASWNGHTYQIIHPDNNGEYNSTHIGEEGCKRIAKAMWWMLARYAGWEPSGAVKINKEVAICDGESYLAGGKLQNEAGNYYDTLKTVSGNDSIIFTHLVVNEKFKSEKTVSVCKGQSYYIFGKEQKNAGIYKDTLISINFCDSIVIVNLNVILPDSSGYTHNMCKDESYVFDDKTIYEQGTYRKVFKNSSGCDSIITLILNVHGLKENFLGDDRKIFENDIININAPVLEAYYTFYIDSLLIDEDNSTLIFSGQRGYGKHKVKSYVLDNFGCMSVDSIQITVEPAKSDPTSNVCGKENSNLSFYPNPSNGLINYKKSDQAENFHIQILSIDGKTQYDEFIHTDAGTGILNLSHLKEGLYIVNTVSALSKANFKIQIIK